MWSRNGWSSGRPDRGFRGLSGLRPHSTSLPRSTLPVTLRGSAAYRYAIFSDSTTVETGYSVGAGADYLVNENISVSGDYRYGATTTAPANTTDQEHRVTLGVTVKR